MTTNEIEQELKRKLIDNVATAREGEENSGDKMKHYTTGQAINRLLAEIEEGILDRDMVIMACVKYMSEDDVADMCHINEFFYEVEEEA